MGQKRRFLTCCAGIVTPPDAGGAGAGGAGGVTAVTLPCPALQCAATNSDLYTPKHGSSPKVAEVSSTVQLFLLVHALPTISSAWEVLACSHVTALALATFAKRSAVTRAR